MPGQVEKGGLPQDVTFDDVRRIIGFDCVRGYCLRPRSFVWPKYGPEDIGREGNVTKRRNRWGGTEVCLAGSQQMPVTISGVVKDWDSWLDVEERLLAGVPGRFPEHWEDLWRDATVSNEPIYAEVSWGNHRYFYERLRELIWKYPPAPLT